MGTAGHEGNSMQEMFLGARMMIALMIVVEVFMAMFLDESADMCYENSIH